MKPENAQVYMFPVAYFQNYQNLWPGTYRAGALDVSVVMYHTITAIVFPISSNLYVHRPFISFPGTLKHHINIKRFSLPALFALH